MNNAKTTFIEEEKQTIPYELAYAESLRAKGELDDALRLVTDYMGEHFEDVHSLVLAAHILIDAGRVGMAQPLLKMASALDPNSSVILNNLGLCYQEGSDLDRGESYFIKSLHRNPSDALTLSNLAQLYVNTAKPDKAINCATRALEIDPNLPEARYNLGLAQLQKGIWKEGWEGYEFNLGAHRRRKERIYGKIPRWTGVKGVNLIAYGEQGVGDEISFASCLPDLINENNVIIECDRRLEGLFKRSFNCPVYGTRNDTSITWPLRHEIDCSVAFGSLPGFYRNSDASFTGEPYLLADPERRIQWRALLDSMGKRKKVGIAWTGGRKNTGSKKRSLELNDLLPVLRQDADFISLQYKDFDEIVKAEKEYGIKIHHWKHAITNDFDDQAALMAELDLVITVTQTAVHLAGALGVPCWTLVPNQPMWRYGLDKDTMPWYKSVKLYRQKKEWVHVISDVARDLRLFCGPIQHSS